MSRNESRKDNVQNSIHFICTGYLIDFFLHINEVEMSLFIGHLYEMDPTKKKFNLFFKCFIRIIYSFINNIFILNTTFCCFSI